MDVEDFVFFILLYDFKNILIFVVSVIYLKYLYLFIDGIYRVFIMCYVL